MTEPNTNPTQGGVEMDKDNKWPVAPRLIDDRLARREDRLNNRNLDLKHGELKADLQGSAVSTEPVTVVNGWVN